MLGIFKKRVNGGENKRLFWSSEVRLKEIDASLSMDDKNLLPLHRSGYINKVGIKPRPESFGISQGAAK